jgi:hypothetical protein
MKFFVNRLFFPNREGGAIYIVPTKLSTPDATTTATYGQTFTTVGTYAHIGVDLGGIRIGTSYAEVAPTQ